MPKWYHWINTSYHNLYYIWCEVGHAKWQHYTMIMRVTKNVHQLFISMRKFLRVIWIYNKLPQGIIRVVLKSDSWTRAPLGVLFTETLPSVHLHLEMLATSQFTDQDIVLIKESWGKISELWGTENSGLLTKQTTVLLRPSSAIKTLLNADNAIMGSEGG